MPTIISVDVAVTVTPWPRMCPASAERRFLTTRFSSYGDELYERILRADASRFRRRFGAWNRYGVSALLARDDVEVDSFCETRLERFPTVIVYRRHDLENVEVEVVRTFRTPHVTLARIDLDSLVTALLTCEHRRVQNPYFDG